MFWDTGKILDFTDIGIHLKLSASPSRVDSLSRREDCSPSRLAPMFGACRHAARLGTVPEPTAFSLLGGGIELSTYKPLLESSLRQRDLSTDLFDARSTRD